MPLIETKGAASAQGFGEFTASAPKVYIEDVFSTYLYTGTGSTQTITNGIDLAGKGGLVWTKPRNTSSTSNSHILTDTARGAYKQLLTNTTGAQYNPGPYGVSFASSGFSLTASDVGSNSSADTYASWTFRKQPKFFDVVTYTGNGQNDRQVAHNLGSTPGCIIVKCLSFTGAGGPQNWSVYHRSVSPSQSLFLNTTAAAATNDTLFGTPTSTYFVVNQPGGANTLNANGDTYVAYLFAHDAGGFGLSGTDNVITCGSFTTDGSGKATITLGYEPQWIMAKASGAVENWYLLDNMRGFPVDGTEAVLQPNGSNADASTTNFLYSRATGFVAGSSTGSNLSTNTTYIYIAIRRGPMKVPTSGTSVFTPIARTGDGSSSTVVNVGFPTDLFMFKWRALGYTWKQQDRLRGFVQQLASDATSSESNSGTYTFGTVDNTGYTYGSNACLTNELNGSGVTSSVYAFRRAPGFFDVVCYTGNATNGRSITHNLGVVPEILIVKKRSSGAGWPTLITSEMRVMEIDIDSGYKSAASTKFFYGDGSSDIAPTSSVFTVASGGDVNGSGSTYVAYLFASVAGVSKVGSYTGTGALQTINCGFTGGARFVLIKRTDSTGGWYVYDSARGISSGNDPYLLLDITAAEVTGTNYVDTTSVGFQVTAAAPAELNANGGTYIFLAIA